MKTNITTKIATVLAAIAFSTATLAAHADSCSQATADANTAAHQVLSFPAGTWQAATTISNAVANAGRCILGNPTPVEDEPDPAPSPDASPTPDVNDGD